MYTVTDSIHGTIRLSKLNQAVIETPIFNRLNNVYQNSTVYFTFPSCRTKRFEHSIGAMHVGGELFYHSVCNSEPSVINELINKSKKHIFDIDNDYESYFCEFTKNIFNDPFYESYIPNFIEDKLDRQVFVFLMESVRILGLLHDIGHPPYSHVVEHSISNALFTVSNDTEAKSKNTSMKEKFLRWNDCLNSKYSKLHEIIGKKLIPMVKESLKREIKNKNHSVIDITTNSSMLDLIFNFILSIFEQSSITRHDEEELVHAFIYRFMNYTIDADRLDFIARDIYSSGVRKSSISLDRMYSNIKVIYEEIKDEKNSQKIKRFYLVFLEKITDTITETLFNRQYIYNQVVYHSKSVKNAIMLERIITELIVKRMIFYLNNDNSKWSVQNGKLDLSIDSILEIIDNVVDNEEINQIDLEKKLAQWDDHWLTVMLKNMLYDPNQSENLADISDKIAELFGSKRKYVTVIKRNNDFLKFKEHFYSKLEALNKSLNLNDINVFLESKQFYGSSSPFGQNLVKLNEALIACENKLKHGNYKDVDIMIGIANRSNGIDGTPYICFSDDKISRYDELSHAAEFIDSEINDMPYFYVYYREKKADVKVDSNQLICEIAENVAQFTIDTLLGFN